MSLINGIRRQWCWVILGCAGAIVHLGTAFLRLGTFFPHPKLVDFAGFYAAAWAIRQGLSPYGLSPEFIAALRVRTDLPFTPPIIYNPPIWPWLLQPLTFFNFSAAAVIWLTVNLALLAWSAMRLARLAGHGGWKARGIVLLLSLTFGPVFLDLTLGQTSVVLLATALAIGGALRSRKAAPLWAATAAGLAVGAKIFPLIWLRAFFFLRCWRLFLLATLMALLALIITFVIAPAGNQDYWFHFLPERITSASEQADVDDQSLVAWFDRLGRPQTFQIPGLSTTQQHTVTWSLPWSINRDVIRWGGSAFALMLALAPMVVLIRARDTQAEGAFYLWLLYGLILFPHIERYNHTLLLPAMAWLWGWGGWQRGIAVAAYFLVGLSRLTHLWAILLPVPWGPLASGFGLYAVLMLGGGLAASLWNWGYEWLRS